MTRPGASTARVGVLGGGQLGRMLALAGMPLGLRFRFLDPGDATPVRDLGETIRADYGDAAALDAFADGLDAVTFEFENVPVETVRRLSERVPVFPPAAALSGSSDRLAEKETFRRLGIPTAPYRAVGSLDELEAALAELGTPAVLKTRRFGYDGKGQWVLRDPAEVPAAWDALNAVPLILEGFVDFRRELSVIAVRARDGETAFYPLVENVHEEGILRESRAPAPDPSHGLQREAQGIAERLLVDLDYVGVIAVELFDTADGLLANEVAPRVHNSGHWTQDGAATSQFENHLRAGLGWPLGSPEALGWSAMVNVLGTPPEPSWVLGLPGARLHLYDKEPRPGRKVGHVNVRGSTPGEVEAKLRLLREGIGGQAAQRSQRP